MRCAFGIGRINTADMYAQTEQDKPEPAIHSFGFDGSGT